MRSCSGWASWAVFSALLGRRWSSSTLPRRGPRTRWSRFGAWQHNLVSSHAISIQLLALKMDLSFWHVICNVVAAFLCYAALAVAVSLLLMLYCAPRYGQTNIMIYVGICSVIGSLTVKFCMIVPLVFYRFIAIWVLTSVWCRVLLGNEHQGCGHCD